MTVPVLTGVTVPFRPGLFVWPASPEAMPRPIASAAADQLGKGRGVEP